MIRALHSDRWLGYAALFCVAIAVASHVGIGTEPMRALLGISVMVFGIYCAIRGVLYGNIPSRICAGFALFFWAYVAYLLCVALTQAKIR